jgi:hypothetical protein
MVSVKRLFFFTVKRKKKGAKAPMRRKFQRQLFRSSRIIGSTLPPINKIKKNKKTVNTLRFTTLKKYNRKTAARTNHTLERDKKIPRMKKMQKENN